MTILFLFVLGTIVGSFLNVVILRIHDNTTSWAKGRSLCTHCKHELAWYDLVPLFSFLILVGRCRYCKKKISVQYPLVELATALLFIVVSVGTVGTMLLGTGVNPHEIALLIRNLAVVCVMIILFVYDFRWQLIPDRITLPAIVIFFLINAILMPATHFCDPVSTICFPLYSWTNYALGAILGGGFFLVQYVISKGKWIGGGDIRLGALMGVILGLTGTAVALFIAYMVGAVWGIALIVSGKKNMGSAIPFGTFLSVATLVVLVWYSPIMDFIQRYLGL